MSVGLHHLPTHRSPHLLFPYRVPSAQLDQALGDRALLAPWGLSTLGPSIRGHQGLPHSEYSFQPLGIWGRGVAVLA